SDVDLEALEDAEKRTYIVDSYSQCLRDLRLTDCCHFIDQQFSNSWTEYLNQYEQEPVFLNIPTPTMEQILNHQRFSEDVKLWVYIMIGRMLFDVGERDDWQVLLFIRGIAGTGKSTIGRVLKRFYADEDVGQLSNNCEALFGLQTLYNKYMWICYEAKENFRLDQGMLQSMISGEPMSIARKHMEALNIPR